MNQFLTSLRYRPILKWTGFSTVIMIALVVCSVFILLLYCFIAGAPPLQNEQNTLVYDREDQVVGVEHGGENRYWIQLDEMNEAFIQATLLTEDRRFYQHFGFDPKRIMAAAIHDIKQLSKSQGASTITQQYARNLYLSHEKTWTRKIKEALYALRLEMFYNKDEILAGYLNTIYYGHGAYGIEAASKYYFDKNAAELTLGEGALLAAIPKGPSYYSPYTNFENAKERQELILKTMYKQDAITEQELQSAVSESINLVRQVEKVEERFAPYFQDMVVQEASRLLDIDADSVKTSGYHIHTSLDQEMQKALEKNVQVNMPSTSDMQVGALSMDPQTGEVLAVVGGRDYQKSSYNRAVQAKRMPGSTFKPFLYYAALESGYTPATTLMSKPTYFELEDGTVYEPSNYNGYYAYEPITLAQAIALSDNVYAVKTNVFLGEDVLVETANKMGITSKLPAVPSLALGTASVSVEEMVGAYSLFANGGKKIEPHVIEKITDRRGKTIYEHKPTEEQILDEQHAFVMANLMTGMFDSSLNDYMQVTGASIADELTRPFAGKSGTTKTDSWMIGYSTDIVTGIWTGYDENKAIEKVKEHQFAKDIWAEFMEEAHAESTFHAFSPPDGVTGVYIDPDSGQLATPYCAHQRLAYFEEGSEPTTYCELHLPIDDHGNKQDLESIDKQRNKSKNRNWLDIMF
ncbi:transglycosylase domain-containing protein [Pontibacillus salicampi]|uniref:Transglycosylase domain-containing protein n=1 Tax=Pontibacillus salicampi TaxID=1449801 RepID=A0ABV6LRZ5_9BACI